MWIDRDAFANVPLRVVRVCAQNTIAHGCAACAKRLDALAQLLCTIEHETIDDDGLSGSR